MTYQFKKIGDFDWQDDILGLGNRGGMIAGFEYRIKPVPAAPKWPQTTMTDDALNDIVNASDIESIRRSLANAAIAHACKTGQVVPADKVREIEAKARAEGVKQERDRNLRMTRHVYMGGFYK